MSIDKLLFAREFVTNLREVGAVLPSSRYLGRASARYSRPANGLRRPLRILEAGAGTGSFTCEIIPQLEPGDCLDAIELNPTLCALLHERLGNSGLLADPSVEVNLINGDLLTFPLDTKYDRIISSLPLTNLPVDFVDLFLAQMMVLLKPGGVFSYVQYAALGKIKYTLGGDSARAVMEQKSAVMDKYTKPYQFERTLVWRNVPPTWVYYWRKPTTT